MASREHDNDGSQVNISMPIVREMKGIALVETNPDPVMFLRWTSSDILACPVVYVNDEFMRFTGFTLEDFDANSCRLLDQVYSLPILKGRAHHALVNRKPDQIESYAHANDGAEICVAVSVMPILDTDDEPSYIMLELHDITELKQTAERGAAVGADLESVLASARCLVWHAIVEHRGESFCWKLNVQNEDAARSWLPVETLPGEPFFQAFTRSVHPEDQKRIDGRCQAAIVDGESRYHQEFRVGVNDGEFQWVAEAVQIEPLTDYRWRLVGVITDIQARKMLEKEREDLLIDAVNRANRDSLTGLYNHGTFHEMLGQEWSRHARYGMALSVILLDVDLFKQFNDSHGHPAGDEALCSVSRILKATVRESDIVARYGGEEFVVVCPETDSRSARLLAERLRAALANSQWPLTTVTGSFGVATADLSTRQPSDLILQADSSLYRSKHNGRNQVTHFLDPLPVAI
jgi:diguanylate cyclase (GGDEF)-like protein/PAS domain S-box-containing protein